MVGHVRRHAPAPEHSRDVHDASRQVDRPLPRTQAPASRSRARRSTTTQRDSGSTVPAHPTINRTLGLLQGVFRRAVEWRRLGWNPVVGVRRLAHTRAATIDARTLETVEAIRAQLDAQNAALVSVLATRAFGRQRRTRSRGVTSSTIVADHASACACRGPSPAARSPRQKSQRGREPELFKPVARELVELYLARGRPDSRALVFPGSRRGHLRRHNCGVASGSRRSSAPGRLFPQLRPPPHLRDAAPLRVPYAERGRRAPGPCGPRLHRAHVRTRHARRRASAHHDQ